MLSFTRPPRCGHRPLAVGQRPPPPPPTAASGAAPAAAMDASGVGARSSRRRWPWSRAAEVHSRVDAARGPGRRASAWAASTTPAPAVNLTGPATSTGRRSGRADRGRGRPRRGAAPRRPPARCCRHWGTARQPRPVAPGQHRGRPGPGRRLEDQEHRRRTPEPAGVQSTAGPTPADPGSMDVGGAPSRLHQLRRSGPDSRPDGRRPCAIYAVTPPARPGDLWPPTGRTVAMVCSASTTSPPRPAWRCCRAGGSAADGGHRHQARSWPRSPRPTACGMGGDLLRSCTPASTVPPAALDRLPGRAGAGADADLVCGAEGPRRMPFERRHPVGRPRAGLRRRLAIGAARYGDRSPAARPRCWLPADRLSGRRLPRHACIPRRHGCRFVVRTGPAPTPSPPVQSAGACVRASGCRRPGGGPRPAMRSSSTAGTASTSASIRRGARSTLGAGEYTAELTWPGPWPTGSRQARRPRVGGRPCGRCADPSQGYSDDLAGALIAEGARPALGGPDDPRLAWPAGRGIRPAGRVRPSPTVCHEHAEADGEPPAPDET